MTFYKIFSVFAVLSFAAAGSALAGNRVKDAAVIKGKPAITVKGEKATVKGEKSADKKQPAVAAARHVKPPSPIVMGRSVSVRHNTKLHHVKVKPLDLTEASGPASSAN